MAPFGFTGLDRGAPTALCGAVCGVCGQDARFRPVPGAPERRACARCGAHRTSAVGAHRG
ncbi:hypothetical protein [Saccharopolyspora cebuensis]|uniref:Uncharacterized protein n=1 Tax=Saccharopolyspora cebuensis TaxID=418759 RepID=A0ABV4CQP0_9PSEU